LYTNISDIEAEMQRYEKWIRVTKTQMLQTNDTSLLKASTDEEKTEGETADQKDAEDKVL
jgi:hypothetical protein